MRLNLKTGVSIYTLILALLSLTVLRTQNNIEVPNSNVLGIASGNLYYLDFTLGLDANDGLSELTPWKTLAQLNSITLQPGDAVYFKRGESWNGLIDLTVSENGTAQDPIYFGVYGTGALPIIQNTSVPESGIYIAVNIKSDYVIIDSLHFTNALNAAITVASGADNVTISNNEFDNVGVGILVQGNNTNISNNDFQDLVMVTNDATPANDFGAIAIYLDGTNTNVTGTNILSNSFINCKAVSIDYGFDGAAIEMFGQVTNTKINYNFAKNNNQFLQVGGPDGNTASIRTNLNTFISYNILKDNSGRVFSFQGVGILKANVTNFEVYNNTIYESVNALTPISFAADTAIANQFILKNNYLYAGANFADLAPSVHENNIYTRWAGSGIGYALTATEQEKLLTDMQFTNVTSDDFSIGATSAAINVAQDIGLNKDYLQNNVPQGSLPDIGAIELINNTPQVNILQSGGSTSVTEGSITDTVQFKLNSAPTNTVTLTIAANTQVSTSPSVVTFTTNDWYLYQSVTITATNDLIAEANHSTQLTFTVSSADTNYNNLALTSLNIAILDNEVACTSFTYSNWSACAGGVRTRTVNTSSPRGCVQGNAILTETCPVGAVTCGAKDVNNDGKLTFLDLGAFARVMNKNCLDTYTSGVCKGKDFNLDNKIDAADLQSFILKYNLSSCAP